MTADDELHARLTDLEVRYMALERFTQELSDVLATQQKTIDALLLETRRLRERDGDDGQPVPNDRPPHY